MEELKLNINIKEILEEVQPHLNQFPMVSRSRAIGGWALQSTNGSYRDGWDMEFCPYNGPENMAPVWTPANDYEKKLRSIQDYNQFTDVSTPSIQKLIFSLNDLGFHVRKARIIKLSAGSESSWHQDGSDKFYQVRLHIPLVTNTGCFFQYQNESYHMSVTGSAYLVHINKLHRIINQGETDRLHFVCHIWDTKLISNFHQYNPTENLGETTHPKEKL